LIGPEYHKVVVDHHANLLLNTKVKPDVVLVKRPQPGVIIPPRLTINESLFFVECKRATNINLKKHILQSRKYLQLKAADKSPACVFVTDGVQIKLYWLSVESRRIGPHGSSGNGGPVVGYGQTEYLRLATAAAADGTPPLGFVLLLQALLLTSNNVFLNPPPSTLVSRVATTLAPPVTTLVVDRVFPLRRGANGHAKCVFQ